MILNEIYNQEPSAYQDTANDNSQTTIKDLRKTRLTLRQIHRLREINDIKTVEQSKKLKLVRLQYAPPAEPAV
jgi:hypothetical protein